MKAEEGETNVGDLLFAVILAILVTLWLSGCAPVNKYGTIQTKNQIGYGPGGYKR